MYGKFTDQRRVLANAAGKNQGVEAFKRRDMAADMPGQAVYHHLDGQRRPRMPRRPGFLQRTTIAG
ncbi:hypothetical protein D3C76_1716150 [compost metagenome]